MTGGALAVTTPHYQWYALLLVMLVALDGRPEWLAFAAGGYYAAYPAMGRYTPPWRLEDAIAYGVPLLVVAAGWLIRREIARRAAVAAAVAAAAVTTKATTTEATTTVAMTPAVPAVAAGRLDPVLADTEPARTGVPA
jgi:hypothetical protein